MDRWLTGKPAEPSSILNKPFDEERQLHMLTNKLNAVLQPWKKLYIGSKAAQATFLLTPKVLHSCSV